MPKDMAAAARDTGLATRGEEARGLAIPQDVDFGAFGSTEIDETQDLRTPRLSIAQPTSDAVIAGEVKAGEFYYAATGRGMGTKVRLQILGYWTGRQFIEDRKVQCRSYDRVIGDPAEGFQPRDQAGAPTVKCGDCVYSKWQGRSTPPPCDVTYNYAVLVSTEAEPQRKWLAYLTLRRTTTDLAKKLNGDHLSDGKPWFAYIYEATTERQQNDQGQWWIIRAQRVGNATQEQMEEAHAEGTRLVERIKASRLEDVIETECVVKDEMPV